MANQDYVVMTNGIGADPSGAYSQIETGWNPTYANGAVTWLPSSASISSAVADTGDVLQTYTKVASAAGWEESNPDTYAIQNVPAGSTVATDYVSIVVTSNTGSAGNGTFTLASSEIASISSAGLITFSSGTGVFVTECVMVISYNADIDEAVLTSAYNPVPVAGSKNLSVYHPASGDAEVTAKFQWTDDDILSIDSVEQATWADLTSASASAQADLLLDPEDNATWVKLDKMKYIRLVLISTDANVDGVADVSGVFEHASTGAYIRYAEDRTAESNSATGFSIGGLGADPS